MKYIQAKWNHDDPDEPVIIFTEIDDERWEHRKVEVFRDGRQGFADSTEEVGGSRLGTEPWPDLEKLGADPEFEINEITAADFELLWVKRRGKRV